VSIGLFSVRLQAAQPSTSGSGLIKLWSFPDFHNADQGGGPKGPPYVRKHPQYVLGT